MRTRCKSIDASDHCLDHLLTGQALLLSFAASCLAARPAGHAPKPGPAFDPKMFGLVPGLSEVISALASILDGNGQSGNYSPTLRDRQFARHIAIHNSVVYDVVPMTSSAKGHYSKCFGEKWPNWHDFPRSGETEGADLDDVRAIWAAKSVFPAKDHPEREMPRLAGGGTSHQRTTLHTKNREKYREKCAQRRSLFAHKGRILLSGLQL